MRTTFITVWNKTVPCRIILSVKFMSKYNTQLPEISCSFATWRLQTSQTVKQLGKCHLTVYHSKQKDTSITECSHIPLLVICRLNVVIPSLPYFYVNPSRNCFKQQMRACSININRLLAYIDSISTDCYQSQWLWIPLRVNKSVYILP